ncbi:hypothetical protein SD10_01370 [Spirosoma radiotolerans]|uniref:Uncharacterized protein n=2 Tax=Spirosoma radiotolerans TaxID=1379870 RepID=A0A0E3ZRE7_9BACT|nr:hypothetical protein SD10_01370 [Spirosoma radiotolerans]
MAQCNQVVREVNKQVDRIIVKSISVGNGWTEPVQYEQVTDNGTTQFYIHIYALEGSLVDRKGAYVIFKDGTVLAWPQAKVMASPKGVVDVNQCLLRLTESEIEQFQEKQIISIRLSTQERSLTLAQSQRAQNIINCVLYAQYSDIKSDKLVNHL